METKRYLGDSVYAEFDGCTICLTTENGDPVNDPSNEIWLEPEVLKALNRFVEELKEERGEK